MPKCFLLKCLKDPVGARDGVYVTQMVAALLTFDRHWKHLTSTRLPLLAFFKHKFKIEADAEYCLHVMTELWNWPGGKVFSLDWQLLFASVRGALQATDPSMVGSRGWGVMGVLRGTGWVRGGGVGWYRGSKGVGVTLSGARQAALRALDGCCCCWQLFANTFTC